MSARGYNLVWIEIDPNSFDADEPMTAYRAWTACQNAQHLIDSSGQYGVNVMAHAGSTLFSHTDSSTLPETRRWEFPLTIMRADQPPNFDVRVAAVLSGGATTARVFATLTGSRDEHNVWGGPSPQSLYYKTTTTTAATSTWVIDEQKIWALPDRKYMRMRRQYPVYENGTRAMVETVMVRFEVGIEGTYSGSGAASIVGASFREFP